MKKFWPALLLPVFCATPAEKKYLSAGAHWKLVQSLTCKVEDPDRSRAIKPRRVQYGLSQKKKPLVAHIIDPRQSAEDPDNIYIIAAQHGDERNTKPVLDYFLREVKKVSTDFRNDHRIIIIPLYNPDGYKNHDRLAADETDLNRDFPTSDGNAENPRAPETRAFLKLMKKYPPYVIYNLHQPFRVVLAYKGDEELARPFAQLSDYPLGQDVGYPTPGSLGTWGQEKKIPVVTVELSRSMKEAVAPFLYEEVRLALFHAAFGCIPQPAHKSRIEKYLAE